MTPHMPAASQGEVIVRYEVGRGTCGYFKRGEALEPGEGGIGEVSIQKGEERGGKEGISRIIRRRREQESEQA